MVKSQSSLLILSVMVAIGIISLIFFFFISFEFRESIVKSLSYFKASIYLDYVKFFERISLHFSVHSGVSEVGKRGGVSQTGENYPRSWICNQVDVPSVEEVRFFLSNETLRFINYYIKNFNQSDILKVNLSEVSCVDFKVSQQEVESGKFDESFETIALGNNIFISLGEENITSLGDLTERISLLRFWYMYRKFSEWAKTYGPKYIQHMCGNLSKICYCNGMGGCNNCLPFLSAVIQMAEEEVSNLERTFSDPYVKCYYNISCCFYGKSDCPEEEDYQGCKEWKDAPMCKDCVKIPFSKPCASLQECSGTCAYFAEVKGAVKVTFGCNDTKYYVSTPKGPQQLIFKVDVTTYLRKLDCYKTESCRYIPTGVDKVCVEIPPGSGECYWVYPGYECDCPLEVYCTKNCLGEAIPSTIDGECECASPPPQPQPPSPPGPQPPQPPLPPPPPPPPPEPP
ncbi:MAG: hypothetical protein QXD54_03790 [Candidatus Aenigmatarchaeota archaeon]